MSGLTSRESLRYQYLLVRSEERWVILLHCFFFCETYVIFMLFLLYIIYFCMLEYLTNMYLLHADVGPVRPMDYARNRHHPRPGATPAAAGGPTVAGDLPAGEVERVLRRVERNFTALTRTVPMEEIKDLPPSMQPHVVGVPRT
jgi:hypothetical protein